MKKIKETTIEDFPLQDFATWRVHWVQQIRADKKKRGSGGRTFQRKFERNIRVGNCMIVY
jgi:hypothetical protein